MEPQNTPEKGQTASLVCSDLFGEGALVEAFDAHERRWRRAYIDRCETYRGRPWWRVRWADRVIEMHDSSGCATDQIRRAA